MAIRRVLVTAVAWTLSAAPGPAAEGAPLSAIDWLSDSIDQSTPAVVPAPTPETVEPPPEISVAPLDAPVPDRAGLIDARTIGLPPGLWGPSSAQDLAGLVSQLPDTAAAPPALQRFIHDLMVVRLDPPIDALGDDSLYLARLDRLLAMGQLGTARELIEAAGEPEPRRFRRAFDIALLTGTENEACRVIEETPDISPTYPARIFCLARNGQWDVAALTLGNAQALGILEADEEKLLLHFLDAELFESEPVPPPPPLPSPLVFRLYEAVGERLSTETLPVAFAAADLSETVGWKTRLRAVERLAGAGAFPVERLLTVYAERKPAASGGIWERVRAVQRLVAALDAEDAKTMVDALPQAWSAAEEGGYHGRLAPWIARRLGSYDLDGAAGHVAFEIALLAGRPDLAKRFARDTAEDRFLLDVAQDRGGAAPPADSLGRAVLRGLSALAPGERSQALIESGRSGEALLRSLPVLMDGGAAGNPDSVSDALAVLRALGLDRLARQIAVELVLKEGAA